MSWIQESKRTWLERFCINVLKTGAIPKHVAFIMDGNRRYATKLGMEKVQGHVMGFQKLSETLEWCLDLGITEVTVYTLSIENFKRPKEEVNGLLNLAREKIRELLQEREKLDKYGVCLRIYGDITLLPIDLQMHVAEAVLESYNNTNLYLNLCLAYTSREEITTAVKDVASEVIKGNLLECDVSEDILDRSMYSCQSTHPDVIVRTSGEVRLSDFLLWQGSYSVLAFFNVLWPDFRIWHLFLAVLYYQHNYGQLKNINEDHSMRTLEKEKQDIITYFQNHENNSTNNSSTDDVSALTKFSSAMEARKKKYIERLEEERYNRLVQIKEGNTTQHTPYYV